MRKQTTICISSKGEVAYLYDDELHKGLAAEAGPFSIQRASSVEPCENGKWAIDIYDGPLVFGFDTRQEALDVEATYIQETLLPSRHTG